MDAEAIKRIFSDVVGFLADFYAKIMEFVGGFEDIV